MGPHSDKIARSPTPPETDDDGDEWPVHGIVGEDVDVFGNSIYEIRWRNWSRADGTNTTWMREIDGDPALVESWDEAMKNQRLKKATESQSIDLTLLASTPMHDRLTFERAQAVEEKTAERLRTAAGPSSKNYQGWMTEIDRQVVHHEQRGEKRQQQQQQQQQQPRLVPQKRSRQPSRSRCVWASLWSALSVLLREVVESTREESYAESSRSTRSRVSRRISSSCDLVGATPMTSDGADDESDV